MVLGLETIGSAVRRYPDPGLTTAACLLYARHYIKKFVCVHTVFEC